MKKLILIYTSLILFTMSLPIYASCPRHIYNYTGSTWKITFTGNVSPNSVTTSNNGDVIVIEYTDTSGTITFTDSQGKACTFNFASDEKSPWTQDCAKILHSGNTGPIAVNDNGTDGDIGIYGDSWNGNCQGN